MNDIKLKPCPFCSGEARLREIYDMFPEITEYYVECTNKKCKLDVSTKIFRRKSNAITAWNRRINNE